MQWGDVLAKSQFEDNVAGQCRRLLTSPSIVAAGGQTFACAISTLVARALVSKRVERGKESVYCTVNLQLPFSRFIVNNGKKSMGFGDIRM